MPKKITEALITKIETALRLDSESQGGRCENFTICTNRTRPHDVFASYQRIDFNPSTGMPTQTVRWLCFNDKGEQIDCDPIFKSLEDSNQFYDAMVCVHRKSSF